MKKLTIIVLIFFTSLSACKDDCLTCPENEAIINGKCECIGINFNGKCINKNEFFNPNTYNGPLINDPTVINVLLSLAEDTTIVSGFNISEFDFTESSIKLYLFPLDWYDNRYRSFCLIQTIRDGGEPYYCGLTSPLGREYSDTIDYYWPSAYEYKGLISQVVKAPGHEPASHYTTLIDGQTCYLRPYIKILDKDYLRVTFRYVTAEEEVKAKCVRLFHK